MTNEEKIQNLVDFEYKFYSKELVPYIDIVEVYFGAIPDGLLNEIRKFTGHICSASIEKTDSVEVRIDNINAAHKHLRRILLDCLKLMCIYKQDSVKQFKKRFRFFNTKDVDDGNFDVNLHKKISKAEKAFLEAKDADDTGKNDKKGFKFTTDGKIPTTEEIVECLDEVYQKYCEASNLYDEIIEYIDSHYEGVVRVAKKAVMSKAFAFLGWAIGIVLTIYSLV